MTEKNETPTIPKDTRDDSPTLLERVYERTTVSGQGALASGGELIPRKRITFDVDGADCAPGMFVNEDGDPLVFRLTLAAPTAAEEMKITKGVTDPAAVVQLTAKNAIEALNGAPVVGEQLEFLWEALGPGGRQLVMLMVQEVAGLSPGGLGKAQASVSR